MMSPFFLAADVVTRATRGRRDGFSWYYQHAAGLAGLTYLLVGLALLKRLLLRHFDDAIALATLIAITWGTNLFHYGTYDSVFSHAYSFCLINALLLLGEDWWAEPAAFRSAGLGLVAAGILLTRHTNAIFLLIVPLYGVASWARLRERTAECLARMPAVAVVTGVVVLAVAPQLVIYRWVTGSWIVSPYIGPGTGFVCCGTHLAEVLFSPQKGLFFWSPLLLLAVAGFFVARGWARSQVVPSAVIIVANTFLIASWFDWQFGGSFGHRGFTDGLGLLAIFLAAFFAWTTDRPRVLDGVAIVATLAVLLSVAQMVQYWEGVLPFTDTTWSLYRELFLRFR